MEEKERRELFEHTCKLQLLDIEMMRERITEVEKIRAEKEIEADRLRISEVQIRKEILINRSSSTPQTKLQITPFDGKVINWQSFWDSFKSAIHENPGLNAIDKFNYLRSLLGGKSNRMIRSRTMTLLL